LAKAGKRMKKYPNLLNCLFSLKDFLIFLCVFYNLLYLPIFLAYNNIYCYFGNYFSLGNIVENLIDLIYLFDIIIT